MKRKLIAGAVIATLFAGFAWAQMGPGMMGGYGPGGYGPGGYRMGPGMMWGYGAAEDYGPGYGMGPGMMWRYGRGPAMMGTYGPGMMGAFGWGSERALGLSDEQRKQIAAIQEEFSRKQWDLMGRMHEQRDRLFRSQSSGEADDAAARKAYQVMADARKALFDSSVEARKRIDAVLTKEQREQLQSDFHCGW